MIPLLGALFGFGLFRLGSGEIHRFESQAALDLSSKLDGEAKKVTIKTRVGPEIIFGEVFQARLEASDFSADGLPLFTEPKRNKFGYLKHLEMSFRHFNLRNLPIDRLDVSIPDSRFDLPFAAKKYKFRLSQSGLGTCSVQISASDLAAFIPKKFHEIKAVSVRFDRGMILVEGHAELLFLSTDFFVVSHLVPLDGTKLLLSDARVLFDGESVEADSAKILLDLLNPILDLDRDLGLHGAVHLRSIDLSSGILSATGTTTIPDLPKNPASPN
jgi:hypothetical protein